MVVGTVEQLSTKTAAKLAVETLRSTINAGNPAVPVTVRQLVKHYEENELPSKAYSTQRTLHTSLKTWVLPKWGEHKLSDVRTVEVEGWLHSLPLANATKAKIRNTMHVIFAHACRHEWIGINPITLVRQSAKREKLPDVLELEELKKLLAELENPARALVFLTAATGLRVSEALGLKWSDVDFTAGEIRLCRAVVHQHVGDMKTEASHLKGCGEDVKTVQELMRHANSRLTLDVYAQALTPAKRAAHLKLVGLIQPAIETAVGPLWSHAEDTVAVSS
jgi:integrase